MPNPVTFTDDFSTNHFADGRYVGRGGPFTEGTGANTVAAGAFTAVSHDAYDGFTWLDADGAVPDGVIAVTVWAQVASTEDAGSVEVGVRAGYDLESVHEDTREGTGLGTLVAGGGTSSPVGGARDLYFVVHSDFGSDEPGSSNVTRPAMNSGRVQVKMTADAVGVSAPGATLTTTLEDEGASLADLIGIFPYVSLIPDASGSTNSGDHITLSAWGYEYDFAVPALGTVNVGLATSASVR